MEAALFLSFIGLMMIRVPIALALAFSTAFALHFFTNMNLLLVVQRMFTGLDTFPFMAIPFFIMAGAILEQGGVSKRLINFASALVGGLPGGLAIVTIVASAFFGAVSGSATATVVAIGVIMLPAMKEEGYPLKFALATVAVGGFLGVVIPPSIPMVVYGISTNTSIGDVFIASIVPGALLCLSMSFYAYLYGRKNLEIPEDRGFSLQRVLTTFKEAIWALIMPGIILGGIYGGIFTPTEAAAVACFYGLLVGFLIYKELDFNRLYMLLKDSVEKTSMIMFIVAAASSFGYLMTRAQVPAEMTDFITSLSSNPIVLLLLINGVLLLIGTFMETVAAIMILGPLLMPFAHEMGIDMTAFGIMMVVNLGIGMATPPLGLNIFMTSGIGKTSVEKVINVHLGFYLLFAIAVLLLITYVPSISLFLLDILN